MYILLKMQTVLKSINQFIPKKKTSTERFRTFPAFFLAQNHRSDHSYRFNNVQTIIIFVSLGVHGIHTAMCDVLIVCHVLVMGIHRSTCNNATKSAKLSVFYVSTTTSRLGSRLGMINGQQMLTSFLSYARAVTLYVCYPLGNVPRLGGTTFGVISLCS